MVNLTKPNFPSMYSTKMVENIQKWGASWIRTGAVVWRLTSDFRFLLVHEAKVKVNGVWQPGDGGWNVPCGRLGLSADRLRTENLLEAAKREVMEESGQNVDLGPIIHLSQRTELDNFHILILFGAELREENERPFTPTEEVSEIGWFTSEEILNLRNAGKLRSPDMIQPAIAQLRRDVTRLSYASGLYPTIRTPKNL